MKIKFLFILFLFVGQLYSQDEPVFLISFEKEVAEFEMGEPIKINCEFQNISPDTLYCLETNLTYPKWEIFKNGKVMSPQIYCGGRRIYPVVKVIPYEKKNFSGDPYPIYYRKLSPGKYMVRAGVTNNMNRVYNSNFLYFKIKNENNIEMLELIEECRSASCYRVDIAKGLKFLDTYEKSHLRDEIILRTASAFIGEKRFDEAIKILKEFDQPDFVSSFQERYEAFVRLAHAYIELSQFQEAIFYFKKASYTDRRINSEINKAKLKLNEKND